MYVANKNIKISVGYYTPIVLVHGQFGGLFCLSDTWIAVHLGCGGIIAMDRNKDKAAQLAVDKIKHMSEGELRDFITIHQNIRKSSKIVTKREFLKTLNLL